MKPENPGDLVEHDTMFVAFNTGRRIAVPNAIDMVSRQAWSLAAVGATAASAKRLLERVCASRMPKALQVDGGSEFRGVFEDACMEIGIPPHVLPPRAHPSSTGMSRPSTAPAWEFFNYFDLPDTATELNPVLQEFMHEYHHVRPHTACEPSPSSSRLPDPRHRQTRVSSTFHARAGACAGPHAKGATRPGERRAGERSELRRPVGRAR